MRSRTSLFMLLAVVALTLLSGPVSAAVVYYVDGENGEDPNDGLSWDTAKATIQAAFDTAAPDDEIWVKAGTYAITSQIQVNKSVGIYGGFAGDETERSQRDWAGNTTTINGQDSTRILQITEEPTIDGFTLTNGRSSVGWGGGAVSIGGLGSRDKTATISNCIISGNTAYANPIGAEAYKGGGAIFVELGDPVFVNCLITNNSTNAYGGATNLYGGSPQFTNCTISKNTALMGGGLYLQGVYTVLNARFYNCIVSGNTGTTDANDVKVKSGGDEPQGSNNCCSVQIGSGTILTDPLFVDPDNDDFHLQPGSPCIDAGTDTVTLPDIDIEAGARVIDGDNNGSAIVDIGAYEAPCRIDVPDVEGLTESDAENSLNAVGLAKGTVTYSYSNTVPQDLVVDIVPPAGTFVSCGAVADMVISNGLPIVPNDLCDSAITVAAGADYLGSTAEATGTFASTCADNDILDVWYSYTATADGLVSITLANSNFDTTLAVYDSCNTEELACNDDFDHPDIGSQVSLYLAQGATCLIRVAGYDHQTGEFTLSIDDNPPGLDNDTCPGAIPVEPNEIYLGTTVEATGTSESGCSYNDTLDTWHSFTPQTNVLAQISLCGSGFDTTLAVYDECDDRQLACNDDYCGLQSQLTVNLTANNPYRIRVAGYDGEMGDYTLTITELPGWKPDFNQDGLVDYGDFAILATYWQTNRPSADIAPEGGDGIIDTLDVNKMAIYWLE
jgi:hypothetical protein